jgi:hypothetical protein
MVRLLSRTISTKRLLRTLLQLLGTKDTRSHSLVCNNSLRRSPNNRTLEHQPLSQKIIWSSKSNTKTQTTTKRMSKKTSTVRKRRLSSSRTSMLVLRSRLVRCQLSHRCLISLRTTSCQDLLIFNPTFQWSRNLFVSWRLSWMASTSKRSEYLRMMIQVRLSRSSAMILTCPRMQDRDSWSRSKNKSKWMMTEIMIKYPVIKCTKAYSFSTTSSR